MPPSETFAVDILQSELDKRMDEFIDVDERLSLVRNRIAISASKTQYSELESDKNALEKRRRELRGEMSALRQAIVKLSRPD